MHTPCQCGPPVDRRVAHTAASAPVSRLHFCFHFSPSSVSRLRCRRRSLHSNTHAQTYTRTHTHTHAHIQRQLQTMTGLRTAWLLVAALCCACALAHDGHDGHDGHDDGNRQDGERKPNGGEQKPDGDDGAKGGNESEEEDPYALKLVEFACEVAGQLRGVNASAETHASALRQSVAKTADYLAEAEKKAAEAANKNESKEVIQKRAAVLAAVVSAHATVLAATANTSEVVDGVKYHAERLLKGLDEYFVDAQRSNASEDIKDVAKSCAAAPAAADVSS
ncbi:hypothetical protein, conserved in T. vivax, partial [Trypanosoma vivax Y486]